MNSPALTPLGRLHEVLADYELAASGDGATVRSAWGQVLDANDRRVPLKLALLAAELLPAVERQIEWTPNSFVAETWGRFGQLWCAPLLHEVVSLDNSALDLPVPDLSILGLLYTADSQAAEGTAPSEERLDEWVQELAGLRVSVADDDSLDPEFRGLLNRRIVDLIDAIKQWMRKGPAGVQAAAKIVLGELVVHQVANKKGKNATIAAVLGIVVSISAGVSAYPDLRDGLVALGTDASHVYELVHGEVVTDDPAAVPPVQQADDEDNSPAA